MNILFINECGSDNLGDKAISLGIHKYFSQSEEGFNVRFFYLEKGRLLESIDMGD
jgi:hypothetical protein